MWKLAESQEKSGSLGYEGARRSSPARRLARPSGKLLLAALRPHQWPKNLLIFVPLMVSHRFYEPELLLQAALGFLCFCLCASSAYVLNDLFDLEADRKHPRKHSRPFASGGLAAAHGIWLVPALLAAAWLLSLALPPAFFVVLAFYFGVTLFYSSFAKRIVLFDALTLAGLYSVRVVAGGAAVSVAISFWLLVFSMFLFLSLAMAKRYTELLGLQGQSQDARTPGRNYRAGDLETVAMFGSASGYMSVLVLALYLNSDDVKGYRLPEAMMLVCPALLYWISRVWLLARRGRLDDDPVVFAAKDPVSRLVAAGVLVVFVLATVVDRARLPLDM
jgi:4-hydroxybenzoate polyprenyltransferase